MNRFAAIESPISAEASPVPSTTSVRASPIVAAIAFSVAAMSKSTSRLKMKAAVGCMWLLITACVTPGSTRDSAAGLAATTRSQPSKRFAPPAATRTACRSSGRGASRTWLVTAPSSGRGPVTSSTVQPLPSRCAAIPSKAPSVMTPVPPIPVITMP